MKVVRVIPVSEQPLTPIFHTSIGGGRVGGGGRSKEALRRAKKKTNAQAKKVWGG